MGPPPATVLTGGLFVGHQMASYDALNWTPKFNVENVWMIRCAINNETLMEEW